MAEAAPAVSDLERRKQVRVRLREDLSITRQKYEGRTYYVVKDPVSLRYYRFKEQERFLLDLMDGTHTLDEAQKQFEARFRPDRLTLEDLEAFTSQLLQAGLAQNESPTAGKQLFDRFKKRQRSKWTQTFLNLLYIKIPIFDPDKILEKMKKPLGFIFTYWFLAASVAIFLTAVGLVLSNWRVFAAKLPTAQEFFTLHTLVYLYIAVGLVKVIHEFGHGLSCKAFGGEVHEMGALLLVFSPCLYCNVSDSWTLPDKWKRIIISAAGIYVELIIASFATFVWWWTDPGTFLNSFCISLMIVCSVSTVIFNANPLMRFDGYYILADWLEIPNLRDRSNRYLQRLAQEYLLGMEVPPEQYMTTGRKVLFVSYAVGSWIYRWIVTFGILYFMYTFLKPYKLSALSYMLGTGAVATMVGWPAYRLIKAYMRRGRVPDMKPARVWVLAGLVGAVLVVLCVVPFPMRVKGLALIQVDPSEVRRVVVPEVGGFLESLHVKDGQVVEPRDPIATLANPTLQIQLQVTEKELALRQAQLDALNSELAANPVASGRLADDRLATALQIKSLVAEKNMLKEQVDRLVLRAPRRGVVMKLVKQDEVGKSQDKGTLICEVGDPQKLQALLMAEPADHELVKPGQDVWIRVHGLGYNYWPAKVARVAAKEATDIPPQLTKRLGGEIVTEQDPQTQAEKPLLQHFPIAIDFQEPGDEIQPGVISRVKVLVEPQTVLWRVRRYLATTFNLGL